MAPLLDILIYAEAPATTYAQGVAAAIMNIISVAVIGTLLLIAYSATRTKSGSLKRKA